MKTLARSSWRGSIRAAVEFMKRKPGGRMPMISLASPSTTMRRPTTDGSPPNLRCQRSEEHTSELQSLRHLVCRLLLEKKKETTRSAYQDDTPGTPDGERLAGRSR